MNQRNTQIENELQMNKMGTMPIGKLLTTMSIPAIASMLINALYNIVDSVFVAQLGQSALAATTLAFPVQNLIIAVAVGTGVGINSLISRRLGEQNTQEANHAASHGIFLAFFNWIIFAAFGFFFTGMFIKAYTDSPVATNYGIQYLSIISIFSLFVFVQINVEKTIQATGNMVLPMLCSLSGAIVNIILDPILIFGLLGAPRLEVAGAAIATIIGEFCAMCLSLVLLFRTKLHIKVSFKGFRFRKKVLANIYAVAFPSIIMQSIGSVMLMGLNAILINLSEAAVAVLGVYYRLQSLIFMPVFGLNQGAMPIFGYNYGAGNRERLVHAFKLAMLAAAVIMGLGLIVFQIFPGPLMKIFNASEEMLPIGIWALRVMSLCFLPAAVGIMASTLFQATGHGIMSLITSLLRQLILILPLAWILARIGGINLVWFSFPLAELFSLATSLFFLKYLFKKEINRMSDRSGEA